MMFHSTIDDIVQSTANKLYLTIIDMSLNVGLGAVITDSGQSDHLKPV